MKEKSHSIFQLLITSLRYHWSNKMPGWDHMKTFKKKVLHNSYICVGWVRKVITYLVVRNYYCLPLCQWMVQICSTVLITLYMGAFKDRHFIRENLKKYRKHKEEKCKLSMNSTQRVTCTLYEDIKRIRLRIPETVFHWWRLLNSRWFPC